jgi:hypothetical protein
MGAEISSCCMSSPSSKQRNEDGIFEELQTHSEQSPISSEDTLFHQIYELVVDDQADELQQLIYDDEIDISKVLWKVCLLCRSLLIPIRID